MGAARSPLPADAGAVRTESAAELSAELAPTASWREAEEAQHFVQFYEHETVLLESVSAFIHNGVESGAAATVIATHAHLEEIKRQARAQGFDLATLRERQQLVMLDAGEALSKIMDRGVPQRSPFMEIVGSVIADARRRYPRVVVFTELAALLWRDGQQSAALQIEELWNMFAKRQTFTLFCAYPLQDCGSEAHQIPFEGICASHQQVIPAESYVTLPSRERLKHISQLQQKAHALERELHRRRSAERSLALLAAVVESSDDAIISKTPDGRILSWNAGAIRLFGYRPEEVIGKPITVIIPPECHQEEQHVLERLRRGERIEHFETVRVAKDGHHVQVSVTLSPVRDANGSVIGASKIARDITERRRADEALREADRRKDEFLAVLAHELRNPLAPVRYALAMSKKVGRTGEQQKRAEEIIDRQVEHMSRLLDDLLDVSRITRGKLELRKSWIELASIITAAVETARPVLDAKHHALSLELPQETVRIDADPVRMAQVFANLLINAAKYTDPGGRIQLRAWRDGQHVAVAVCDNGIGISPDMMSQLFTPFFQARSALERSEGGLGIGLALVRGLVTLHGGSVEARSEGPQRGSEFIVRLPSGAAVPQPQQAGVDSQAAPAVPSSPLRVIVADDNRDSAETCAALLQLCGHQVQIAHTGREALELAESLHPHAMLLDIGMPELDGYTLAGKIRGTAWGRGVTLIAITGWGQEDDKRRALAAGFNHHLTKPIDPNTLEALLHGVGASA